MKQLLRTDNFDGQSWFDVFPHVEKAMNAAALSYSKQSHRFFNYGFHLCFEAEVFSMHSKQADAFETMDKFIALLHRDWSAAHTLMLRQQEAMRLRMEAHW